MVVQLPTYTHKAELLGASVALVLFTYTALLQATLRMLYCVDAPVGDRTERRLFLHGSTQCTTGGWQLPLFVLLAVLVLFPVIMYYVARRTREQCQAGNDDYRLVNENLCVVYHNEYYWWESVLLAQRLLLSSLVTFANSQPVVRSTLATAVCLVCLVLHLVYRPLRSHKAMVTQTSYLVRGPGVGSYVIVLAVGRCQWCVCRVCVRRTGSLHALLGVC